MRLETENLQKILTFRHALEEAKSEYKERPEESYDRGLVVVSRPLVSVRSAVFDVLRKTEFNLIKTEN